LPPIPKPPRKPRKSKFQTEEEYTAEVKEWKAIKLLPIRADSGGHQMTQRYYTEHLLSVHMNMVQESRHHDMLGETVWCLQEDGDPSHGTKSKVNIAVELGDANWVELRDANWIPVIIHPGQSPNLNPIEGVWLILKERAKKRIQDAEGTLNEWDGTKNSPERILREVWDSITMEQIRERIIEMPGRCVELTCNGGENIRSGKW
jgi:hypothetical protein